MEEQIRTLAVTAPPPVLAPLTLDNDGPRRLYEAWRAGRNGNTRRAYEQTAHDFAEYIGRRFARAYSPAAALQELLRLEHGAANLLALDYRTDLLARKLSPGTISLRLSNLRAAVRLARMLGVVGWSLETPSLKVEKYRDTEGPGVEAVRRISAGIRRRAGARAARDRALLALLYGQGLRRGEVVELDVVHLDVAGARVSILGKGHLEREWVKLAPPVVKALTAWLEVRPGPPAGPLFLGWRGKRVAGRLTGSGIAQLSGEWGVAVGVGQRCRPHGFRHTAATALLDAGMTWAEVAGFTRHQDPSTLRHYDDNRAKRGAAGAKRLAELVKL